MLPMPRLFSDTTKVSFVSHDNVFIVIDKGIEDKFLEDSIICFYEQSKKKKVQACGIVVLSNDKSAVVIVKNSDRGLIKAGRVGRKVDSIPDYLNDKGELSKVKKELKKKSKKESSSKVKGHKVVFISENNKFAIILKESGESYEKGMEVCFYKRKKKKIACSHVGLISKENVVVPLSGELANKVKKGMRVVFTKKPESNSQQNKDNKSQASKISGSSSSDSGVPNSPDSKDQNIGLSQKDAKVEKEMQANLKKFEVALKNKEKELAGLRSENEGLVDSLNRKPVFMRVGGYMHIPIISRFSFNSVEFKTIGANQFEVESLWENGSPVTTQLIGLGGEVHWHWKKRLHFIQGFDYNQFPMVRRNVVADEFNSERIANIQIKSDSYAAYFGLLSREGPIIKGLWEWGLYLEYDRSFVKFDSYVQMPTDNQTLYLASLSAKLDLLSMKVPLGLSWSYRRYLVNFQFQFIIPMLMKIQDINAHVSTGTLTTLSQDGAEDLKKKINLQKNPFGFELSLGIFL